MASDVVDVAVAVRTNFNAVVVVKMGGVTRSQFTPELQALFKSALRTAVGLEQESAGSEIAVTVRDDSDDATLAAGNRSRRRRLRQQDARSGAAAGVVVEISFKSLGGDVGAAQGISEAVTELGGGRTTIPTQPMVTGRWTRIGPGQSFGGLMAEAGAARERAHERLPLP